MYFRKFRLGIVDPAIYAAVFCFVIYFVCLPPGVSWWDTAEAQTVPYVAGIFHPTGFPAYAIAGWVFTHCMPFGNVAWRMSLFSAVATALAAATLVIALQQLDVSRNMSILCGLAFGTMPSVWEHATRAGVNVFALLLVAVSVGLGLRRKVRTAAYVAGLSVAAHPISIWIMPGLALLIFDAIHVTKATWRIPVASAFTFALAICTYAYLPVRDAMISAARLDPTALLPIAYHPIWDYDHPSTVAGFVRLVTGADFSASGTVSTVLDLKRYPVFFSRFAGILAGQLTVYGVFVACLGIASLRKRPLIAFGLLLAAFGVFPFALSYWTLTDPNKYYLPALWIASLLLALGITQIERGAQRLGVPNIRLGAIALVVLIALHCADAERFFAQRTDRSADAIIASVQHLTPDGAVIATPWWYATPLFYASYVDRSLGKRLIVTNVSHDDIVNLAHSHSVYYFPLPDNDINIAGAVLINVPNGWPTMYHVTLP